VNVVSISLTVVCFFIPDRRQLTRLSLVLSHIATELSAFFPHGVYEGESVEIRERDAAAFWTHAFDDRCVVEES